MIFECGEHRYLFKQINHFDIEKNSKNVLHLKSNELPTIQKRRYKFSSSLLVKNR